MKIEIDGEVIRDVLEAMKEAVYSYECEDPHEARIVAVTAKNELYGCIQTLQAAAVNYTKEYFSDGDPRWRQID